MSIATIPTKIKFTEDDIDNCWPHYKSYFLEVLNNEYNIERAREDLQSLIGSKYDLRVQGGQS
ncbi:MAG: hypothetical protein A2W23_07540 [Planctomycetes bacterium RBG_16_43_13]|nr:MAG: hypothetical protein A2W23_07540 [Planctomycetes bacterium RBG_16_43_13]